MAITPNGINDLSTLITSFNNNQDNIKAVVKAMSPTTDFNADSIKNVKAMVNPISQLFNTLISASYAMFPKIEGESLTSINKNATKQTLTDINTFLTNLSNQSATLNNSLSSFTSISTVLSLLIFTSSIP